MDELLRDLAKLNPYLLIFTCNKTAYEFLFKHKVFKNEGHCPSCNNVMFIRHNDDINKRVFFCVNNKCKNKRKLNFNSIFNDISIEYYKILRVIYCYVFEYNTTQTINFCEISKPTLIKIKDLITNSLTFSDLKIGGSELHVQVDEMAICNGMIIKNPSSTLDTKKNVQWIIGGIDNSLSKKFFLCLVPDRKSNTIYEIFKKYIKKGSLIIADGYLSYSTAVKKFNYNHVIVNHTEGFNNLKTFT